MATTESATILQEEASTAMGNSPVRILSLRNDAERAWDRFVLQHPSGTFFHQTAWKRVMEKTYGYEPFYFYAERHGQITGIAPVFLVSSWVTGRVLLSLPFAVYGGICANDAESEAALLARVEQLAQELQVEHLELRDRQSEIRPAYHHNSRYSTFTYPLVSDISALYKGLPKDIRYMIRKGEKAALTSRRGPDQLDVFYDLMTVNLRRLGTPAFPLTLFENLIREYPGQVDLTVIYAGSKAVAGGMSFRFREWLQPYYVGSLDEAKALGANNYLWWEMMKLAVETGHTTFDFGRSKNGSGNFDFKKKWGPHIETLSYQVRLVRRKEMPNFSHTNPKFEMVANVWKKLPLGLTRAIGPRVVRWFP